MNADTLSRRMAASRTFWDQKMDERREASNREFQRTGLGMILITLVTLLFLSGLERLAQ